MREASVSTAIFQFAQKHITIIVQSAKNIPDSSRIIVIHSVLQSGKTLEN